MSPLLFALFLGTFAIGTTEFAVVGLLPDIADGLGVSITQTGLLVSGYAIGVAIGGPAIVALTQSQPRSGRCCNCAQFSSRVMRWRRLRRTTAS
jgi:MFS transporter, DHA1 family, inner membrane transport protein